MNKFKVGDNVKMKTTIFTQVQHGTKGVVKSIEHSSPIPYNVHFFTSNLILPVKATEIELI